MFKDLKGLGRKLRVRRKFPFYYAMIYIAALSANQIEEFKYRKRGDKVLLHDRLHPAFTDMNKDDDLFKMVAVDFEENLEQFIVKAQEKSKRQNEYFIPSDFIGKDNYIFITSIPWISFTHISHTFSLNKDDSVPRISWGRYYNADEKVFLPFSVQVNHCFADGIHIGRYKDRLESDMNAICGP